MYGEIDIMLGLAAVALVAGYVDAIAGGGGLLTVPALLYAGLPPVEAVATNKLQGSFGVAASSYAFWKAGRVDLRRLWPAISAAATGAALGGVTVRHVDPGFLRGLVPVLLVILACYYVLAPRTGFLRPSQRLGDAAFAALVAFPVGFYDGFLGPGAGSFYLTGFVLLAGADLIDATGRTKVLNLASNVASLGIFLAGGDVSFSYGMPMIVGQALGSWLGAHSAMHYGSALIRPMVVMVSLAMAIRLLLAG